MSEIDRAELARLASEAGQGPCTIKRDYYNHPVVRFGELGSGIAHFSYGPSETNAAFVVAACNAVPVLLAQLAAAEQRAERAEDRAAVLTDRLNTATTDCSLLLGSLGLAEGRGSVVAAERDALRARVAELEAL
jgi:hypothetical protein